MMTLRPAMLEAFWAGGHTSPGSGNPDKPLRIYPDFATARGRYKLRSEEHTSELQSLMRISYAVFCLKKKKNNAKQISTQTAHIIITVMATTYISIYNQNVHSHLINTDTN